MHRATPNLMKKRIVYGNERHASLPHRRCKCTCRHYLGQHYSTYRHCKCTCQHYLGQHYLPHRRCKCTCRPLCCHRSLPKSSGGPHHKPTHPKPTHPKPTALLSETRSPHFDCPPSATITRHCRSDQAGPSISSLCTAVTRGALASIRGVLGTRRPSHLFLAWSAL